MDDILTVNVHNMVGVILIDSKFFVRIWWVCVGVLRIHILAGALKGPNTNCSKGFCSYTNGPGKGIVCAKLRKTLLQKNWCPLSS